MSRIRLSRAALATLAIATLASFSTLVVSDTAQAGRIDPGFNRGPPRIDPGMGNGTKVDPGFGKSSGPTFTVKQAGHYGLSANCHWVRGPGWHHWNDGNTGKIKVCN